MLNDFDVHKTIEEARERHEHAAPAPEHPHGSRWIPITAALLAVVAAIATLLSNQRATKALEAKNEAIYLRTEASDTYNFYESRSIKQHLYEAELDTNPALALPVRAKLTDVAQHENSEKKPLLEKAQHLQEEARQSNERAEVFMHAHEIMEGGVTLFEVAIAIISISALTSSTFLIGFAVLAASGGLAALLYGFTIR